MTRSTSNYSATSNLHTSHFTTALAKFLPACCVFTSRSLQWLLTVESLQLHALRFCLHSLSCRTQLSTNWVNQSQSPSYFTTGGLPSISSSWRQGPLRLTTCNFFQLNTCGHSPYVTSSLTRGWVCRLQLLLVLASAVILRSDSRGSHDHILLSQIRDSPYLYLPGTGWPSYARRHCVPFSSLSTTRRATVEVFDPARIE
jgi:hypothetical protein